MTVNGTIKAEFEKLTEERASTEPTKEYNNLFTDVSKADWYYEPVKFVNQDGLMSGTSGDTFSPDIQVTRGMLVAVLFRMEHEPSTDLSNFSDVASGEYYAKAVSWANANGIVKGVNETEFAPNDNITREQMATIIYRYAKFKNKGPEGMWAIKMDYTDLRDISDYALDAVMFCKLKEIMTGNTQNMFLPQANATRAEAAAVIQRIIENILK